MKRLFTLLMILTTLNVFTSGCKTGHPNKKLTPGQGYVNVTGGRVWYKVVGSGDKTPLLILHGGPGATGYYLTPLEALGKDRPVIFFDQVGCGRSGNKLDTALMNTESFVNSVEELRKALGLNEYYLYGQSWGTMLGVDYYLKYPKGIKAMILSSPAISVPLWLKDADTLIATLPDSIQNAIRENEKRGTYDAPEYQQAMDVYYKNFVARKLPWSADIDSTFRFINTEIYNYMEGPSEFTFTGNLKNYDRTGRLHEIKVPTLFICGEYDEARPPTVKYYASLVPGSKFAVIKDAAHMTMQDNPKEDIRVIGEFLNEVDRGR